MPSEPLSALSALAGAGLAAGDLFYAVDVSASPASARSKGITAAEMGKGLVLLGAVAGLAGKVLVVDAVNGSDSTGTRGRLDKPYLTPAAAKAAASSGDVIIVYPGAYTCAASLAKDGVDWHFHAGATVAFADDVSTAGVWDDGGAAMTFAVTGRGAFVRSTADDFLSFNAVNCTHASSNIRVEAASITATAGSDGTCSCVWCAAGTLDVTADLIACTGGNAYAVGWTNGTQRVRARRITSEYQAVAAACSATPTGDGHVFAEEIAAPVAGGGTNATAAFWVRADTISGLGHPAVTNQGSNRLYVQAMKLFGAAECLAGLLYLDTQKIAATANGTSGTPGLIHVTGGTARINAGHLDPVTFTGEMLKVTGGTLVLNGGDYTGGASANGFEHAGGTSRLRGVVLNTAAAAAKNPVTVSGAGLVLDHCTLVANAARESVTAGSAQTVTNYGSAANAAKSANVTVNVQALAVDANVI